MIARTFLCLIPIFLGLGLPVSQAIVRDGELLGRWSFDEGNGTNSIEVSGSGVNAILEGASWGSGANAMSRYSLDVSDGSSYARVPAHPNLQARIGFSLMLWFKSNGQVGDYAQILSKRDGTLSPYFVQVEQGGSQIKSMFRFFANYVDNGAFSFNQFQWHFLTSTYDGDRYKTYFDGVLSGSILKSDPVYVDNGDLGIGGSPDGSNLFKGWIDDVRLYKVALTAKDIETAYGNGFGDFGPEVDLNVSRASNVSPIPVLLTFRDASNNLVNVSGFDMNNSDGITDLSLTGGTISNFVMENNSTYKFDLIPESDPRRLFLTVSAGAAMDGLGDYSQKNSVVVTYNKKVTRSADLVGWWSFDEANGTLVSDESGGDAFATLVGGASIDTSNQKFGTGALLLDGSNDWAEVASLTQPSKITRFENLEGWWPLDGNASDMSGKNRDGTTTANPSWGVGRMGQAFDLSGNDHIEISGYKGISGASARTVSLWAKTESRGYLVSWGEWLDGKAWALRINDANDFRFESRGPTRRTFQYSPNDGLWHNWVVIQPEGGADRADLTFFYDGKEVTEYGQWGTQNNLNASSLNSVFIGRRITSNYRRFVGMIDDVRIYNVALTDFEVDMLYREAQGSPLDLGENSYSVSTWVKPSTIKATPEYDFAIGWYEGNGNNAYIGAKFIQGTSTDYNSMDFINPGDSLQSSLFPSGMTERLFDGSFGNSQLDDIDAGTTGFRNRTGWVYQDTGFDIPIDFNEVNVNARSLTTGANKSGTGAGTGRDNIGGLWYGKFRVGNSGYLKTGNISFATRSDDGSTLWIDLDENGDFSKTGSNGSEMVVDNKGNHGQRNRYGTRFLGRKSPLLLRAGILTHKGQAIGSDGFPTSWHATYEQEYSGLSGTPFSANQWYHLVTVVDRETGRLKQYINGQLTAENSFPAGKQGEIALGDWFIGGMPSLYDRFAGLIDDARIYSVALSDEEVSKIFNNEGGDMGLVADFTAPSITDDSNISVNLRFLRFEEPVLVTGLVESDLNVSGATVSNFISLDGNFSFNLIPLAHATEITISLNQNAGQFGSDGTLPAHTFIQLVPPVPGKSDLVSWWWLDEGRGSLVTDSISSSVGS